MQQALDYAEALDVPFVFSSNGDGFLFHDSTGAGDKIETELTLDQFPSPDELWRRYCQWKGLDAEARKTIETTYYDDGSDRAPPYYQPTTNNLAMTAHARGQDRHMPVKANRTRPTY